VETYLEVGFNNRLEKKLRARARSEGGATRDLSLGRRRQPGI